MGLPDGAQLAEAEEEGAFLGGAVLVCFLSLK